MNQSSYLRFLNLIDALGHIKSGDQLDSLETILLNHIGVRKSNGQELLVNDLIFLIDYGSPATLHKRIKSLVSKRYIDLIVDAQDGRKKSVVLTQKAIKHFDQLSGLLEKVVKPY